MVTVVYDMIDVIKTNEINGNVIDLGQHSTSEESEHNMIYRCFLTTNGGIKSI